MPVGFFGRKFRWGVINRWRSVSSYPPQDETLDVNGRLVYKLSLTPDQFTTLNSALINGLEIFPLEEYSDAWDAWTSQTNATYVEPPAMTIPVGTIIAYAGDAASIPTGWLLCDGRQFADELYPALRTAIGNAYGGGAGVFNVPDLRGRTIVMPDPTGTIVTGITQRGQVGGQQNVTLNINQMPSHNHNIGNVRNSGGALSLAAPGNAIANSGNLTSSTGGGQAHNNMQPFNTMWYIIRALP